MKQFTLYNLTDESLAVRRSDIDAKEVLLSPSSHVSLTLPLNLRPRSYHRQEEILVRVGTEGAATNAFSLGRLQFRNTWRLFRDVHAKHVLVYGRRVRLHESCS